MTAPARRRGPAWESNGGSLSSDRERRKTHPTMMQMATLLTAWLRPRPALGGLDPPRPESVPPRVALPFATDVPVRSYLNHAFPLSIVSHDPNHRAALFASFIQLFFPDDKLDYDRVLMLPSLRLADWERLGFLETRVLDPHAPAIGRPARLVQVLVEHVSRGYYAETHIDEHFLPGRACHLKVHSVHDNMIVGYDLAERTFRLAGYGRDYEVADVAFEDLAAAFYHMPRGQLRRRLLRLIRPRATAPAPFDLAGTAAQIRDYVHSRATLSPRAMRGARLYWKARRFTGTWGLDAYASFAGYVERTARDARALDLRVTRTLWEHKGCMLARLRYLESEGHLPGPAGFARRYAPVEQLAQAVRFEAYEYNACGFRRRHADAIAEALQAMSATEADVLRDVARHLQVQIPCS